MPNLVNFMLQRNTIRCKITVNSDSRTFSVGIQCLPSDWNSKRQSITANTPETKEYNNRLAILKAKFIQIENEFMGKQKPYSATTLIQYYQHGGKHLTFKELLERFIEQKRIELTTTVIAKRTFQTYCRYNRNVLKWLINDKFNDLLAEELTIYHYEKMRAFLKNRGLKNSYINKHKDLISGALQLGLNQDLIAKYPLRGLKDLPEDEPEVIYLEAHEEAQIKMLTLGISLAKSRFILLFCIETGIHISDYLLLGKRAVIEIEKDGSQWLCLKRIKTGVKFEIPLSETAQNLVSLYGNLEKLPKLSAQKHNNNLKEIAVLANINKKITSKVGRKTFTDTKINRECISLDTTAEMLGLTSIQYLKNYGSINRNRIKNEMNKAKAERQ